MLVGTSNPVEFLKDSENRRFPVVSVRGEIDLQALERDRDQLWGEAVHEVRKMGVDHVTLPPALWEVAEKHSQNFRAISVFEEWFSEWISNNPVLTLVTADLDIEIPDDVAKKTHNQERSRVLNAFGYVRKMERVDGKSRRVWRKVLPTIPTIPTFL